MTVNFQNPLANKVILYILIGLSISAYSYFCYEVGRYHQSLLVEEKIQVVPDINPGVCGLDIESFSENLIRGFVDGEYCRVRFKGNYVQRDNKGRFEIQQ